MCTLADSEDPNIMPHYEAFHLGPYYFLKKYKYDVRERNEPFQK